MHPGFSQKGKPIAPRDTSIKGPPNKKNKKESNKLLEKPKRTSNSLPKWREYPEFRKKIVY